MKNTYNPLNPNNLKVGDEVEVIYVSEGVPPGTQGTIVSIEGSAQKPEELIEDDGNDGDCIIALKKRYDDDDITTMDRYGYPYTFIVQLADLKKVSSILEAIKNIKN